MNLRLADFKGKFNYDEIKGFLSVFLRKQAPTQQPQTTQIEKINSYIEFRKKCFDFMCYALLLDGKEENK